MNIVGPPLGKFGHVPKTYPEWNVNQAIVIFTPGPTLNSSYLLHVLRNQSPAILRMAHGARQLNINVSQCRSFPIPLPPLSLQQRFAAAVADIRAMQDRQAAAKKRLDDLFHSLLHRAFRGEL